MQSFTETYKRIAQACVRDRLNQEISELSDSDYEEHHLACLLHPEDVPPVVRLAECSCSDDDKEACEKVCDYHALSRDEDGNILISSRDCIGCADCIRFCEVANLTDRKEIVPIFEMLHSAESQVYAMIAPAYIGQFSEAVTSGKLRSTFKKLGFTGMIEVALFADILTLREALEFDVSIQTDSDYMLTSCCCPIWISMIKKVYNELIPHLPPSVSPMVACGRSIKRLHPGAKTVFIGPCIAKKAEARQKDIDDAVDYVLTFEEMKDILDIAGIDPSEQDEDVRDHSSTAGRIYARTAGVSQSVKDTLERLRPDKIIALRAQQADGAAECKVLLKDILNGEIKANFLEGMGCKGGCIGGPKVLVGQDESRPHINHYGEEATYKTPVDNPYVISMLERLGFDTIESLLNDDSLFVRDLTAKN